MKYFVFVTLFVTHHYVFSLPHYGTRRPITSDAFLDLEIVTPSYQPTHNWRLTREDLNTSLSFATTLVNHLQRLETNLQWSQIKVRPGSPSHGQYIDSQPEVEALRQGKDAMVAARATSYLKDFFCFKHSLNKEECLSYISGLTMHGTPLHWACPDVQDRCYGEHLEYRSIDGTCNNYHRKLWGKSFTAYKRLLPARYTDGVQMIRTMSVAKKRTALPSARLVSTTLCGHRDVADNESTLAAFQWGLFVEQDMARTAVSKMVYSDNTIQCCEEDGYNLAPRHRHPLCAHISVPSNDPFYSDRGISCIPYVRSLATVREDCTYGPIEQTNQATHFLDASNLYGINSRSAIKLRSFKRGQLRASWNSQEMPFLPTSEKPTQHCLYNSTCYKAGDPRVNSQPQTAAMHTVWLREHNRVARALSILRRDWDDEKLYQEARRIVIAEIQHITYQQWLPVLLGRLYTERITRAGDGNFYPEVDPRVSNSFATAAIRVFNSMAQDKLDLYNENREISQTFSLREHFYRPGAIQESTNFDDFLRGLTTQSSQKIDTDFVNDITNRLYENDGYGFDALSLDIQRGRDHGLPSYVSIRKMCKLQKATSFLDFSDVMTHARINRLKTVYLQPEDVDLLAGAMSETPLPGSTLGPTFACLFADQFLRTKYGDRYFYTNPNQLKPFTRQQLDEIEKASLARILCDNGDDIQTMQANVFRKISKSNPLVSCISDDIPFMNLSIFGA